MTETMTIREMCDAYDVTPRTLRFYERRSFCSRSVKGPSGCSPGATGRG